ncbi:MULTISPECIES: aldo/keto reductase [Saccharopolyspora]|uniref:Aldo/keto reductase n=1 Tax=Saccharopolyspora cebuensis TaxID=418759 RepID=A0ABV4CC78_9PSEU
MIPAPPPHRLGIGLAALGRPAYINLGRTDVLPVHRSTEVMRERTRAVLDAAHAAGLRWIDAARSYGSAEHFLADWLRTSGHEDVVVSSKWGYAYVADWQVETEVHEVKEHSLERLRSQWAQTRELLDDRIDLYQVHSLTTDSPLFEDVALQRELARVRDAGVALGLSTSGAAQGEAIERAWELEVGGRQLFSSVQATWNSLEPSAGRVLAEVRTGGWRVLVKESLANGRLAVQPPEPVAGIARRRGTAPDAVALAHALHQPWADVVLIGPASVDQLRSNLAGLDLELTADELDELATAARDPATYWGERAALAWQ